MTSLSQLQGELGGVSEDELACLLSRVRSTCQTQDLRARLPKSLAPFASNITIVDPIENISVARNDGLYCSCFSLKERKIHMAVTSHLNQEVKPLELHWQEWMTDVKYATGGAQSVMHSISLNYGARVSPPSTPQDPWYGDYDEYLFHQKRLGEAFVGEYGDPGIDMHDHFHGSIKSVVREVMSDMGFVGEEAIELATIEALLGDDSKEKLKGLGSSVYEGPALWEVIDDEIEDRKGPFGR